MIWRVLAGVLVVAGCLVACLAACGQSLAWPRIKEKVRREFPEVRQLSVEELAQWLAEEGRQAPVLLDVREAEEYAVSHLPGALHAQPGTTPQLPAGVSADTPIVTYCSVGYRSSDLVRRLQEAGYQQVWNLEGSIFEWANAGQALRRGEAPADVVHPYNEVWGRLLKEELRAPLP